MAEQNASKLSVYAALVGNLLVAATKFFAAAWTGSSSMLSEAVHSLVDTGNEALLLYGYHRAALPPDPAHPLGHGRELYFWSFIVALLLFALGAGVSAYEGVMHILDPEPIENVGVNYIVLVASFLFEGASWTFALRAMRKTKGDLSYWQAFRRSKDPPSFMVLFEDSAALMGILVAAGGIYLSQRLDRPELDGVASILIAIVLAVTALFLARESKELLIGERASARVTTSILSIARTSSGVDKANGALTVHLAPDQIFVALSIEFADHLTAPEIEEIVIGLETRIRKAHPQIVSLFVKPQTWRHFQDVVKARSGAGEALLQEAGE